MQRFHWILSAMIWIVILGLSGGAVLAQERPLGQEEAAIARSIAESRSDLPFLRKPADRAERRVVFIDAEVVREKDDDRRLAQVTHYVYDGNRTILTTVDLGNRRIVRQEEVEDLPVPLAAEEFARAVDLALEDDTVRRALDGWADRVEPEVLLLRAASKDDPLYDRRAVRMMFRIETGQYLDWPIAIVDLSRGTVTLETTEPEGEQPKPTDLESSSSEPLSSARRADSTPAVGTRPSAALERRGRDLERVDESAVDLTVRDPTLLDPSRLFRTCCPRHTGSAVARRVDQHFPPSGATETSWRVHYGHAPSKGLYITGAWFKKSPQAPWMKVLYDARLSDIFVPYHSGQPRYLDLTGFNFSLEPVSRVDLGCCGTKADDFVVKEVRDRGILWKDDQAGRRGHELVLWGTLDAANYNYVIAYHFRDDGSIGFRLGATAQNLPGARTEAHMHNALWRIDVDLGGAGRDTVLQTRHQESIQGPAANDAAVPFDGGTEGFLDWSPLEFTGLRVRDETLENAFGESVAYDLLSMRPGNPRHQEAYMHHDFWVTRYRGGQHAYTQLPNYIADNERVVDTDIVLWHVTPAHHVPRREDGRNVDNLWNGVALVMWTGFDLRPRNLFDGTPLHP